jgi:hypothetical protein
VASTVSSVTCVYINWKRELIFPMKKRRGKNRNVLAGTMSIKERRDRIILKFT